MNKESCAGPTETGCDLRVFLRSRPLSKYQGLVARRVSANWWKGTDQAKGRRAAFFAPTEGELIFKHRQWLKKFKPPVDPAAERMSSTFRDLHGFGAGDQVHYTPDYSEHGYTVITLRQPHKVYTIAMTSYNGDDTPVAWLNGVRGCVPISRLSHVITGGTAA